MVVTTFHDLGCRDCCGFDGDHHNSSDCCCGAADGNGTATAMDGCDTGAIVDKSSGGSNAVLKSMLEQLFSSASGKDRFIGQATDVSGDATKTRPQPMTFQAGDTIVFYVRVKTALTVETAVLGQYEGLDASGIFTRGSTQPSTFNADSKAALVGDVSSVFPGGVGSSLYGWMGGGYQHSRTFSQTDTDVSDANVFDAHVWRISATLN